MAYLIVEMNSGHCKSLHKSPFQLLSISMYLVIWRKSYCGITLWGTLLFWNEKNDNKVSFLGVCHDKPPIKCDQRIS